jgi:predicted TIM-barrel fold metal-dependent hydrolase
MTLLAGCGQEAARTPAELGAFINELKANGVEGSLFVRAPFNADMDYIAEYTIARYASTRVISVFKFKDAEKAQANLQDALKNDKLSGQARNATFVMAATFYPPDEEAVEKIKALFLAHKFDR